MYIHREVKKRMSKHNSNDTEGDLGSSIVKNVKNGAVLSKVRYTGRLLGVVESSF